MRKTLLYVIFLCLVSSGILKGQDTRIDFVEYTLDNGLHVILHQDNTTPVVGVTMMYHVGSKNEAPDRTGFAHFFEHLMFEGTKNIKRGEFDRYVEGAGGTLNAYTSQDVTYYFVLLPSNQLELGLWLESERLLHASVDSTGIATQKDVVTEEMKQVRDNPPYGRLLIETVSRAFTDHPYQWDVLGREDHIRNAEDHKFHEFHKRFYVPQNVVLTIAGDIDTEKAKKLVNKYFADIPAGTEEIYRPPASEPVRKHEVRDTVFDNVQLPLVLQAYHIPEIGGEDYYAVDMLASLLSRGQSSRLHRSLVDEQQIAMAVQAMPLALEHPGLAIIFALPNLGTGPDVLEKAINEELEKARNELISEFEMEKLRNQMENNFVNSNTTIASRANNLATYHLLLGDANRINTEIDNYMKVTREDILRAANQYFREDNRVVLYFLPETEK